MIITSALSLCCNIIDHIFHQFSYFHLIKINSSWSKKKVQIGPVKMLPVKFYSSRNKNEIYRKIKWKR